MKKWLTYFFVGIGFILFKVGAYAQTGAGDNFNDNILSCRWNGYGNYTLVESGNELTVTASIAAGNYVVYELALPSSINITANPVLTVSVRSSIAFTLRADLQDASGNNTNATPVTASISSAGTYSTYTFNFAGKFSQTFPTTATVNSGAISKILFFVNPGGSAFSGNFKMDNLQLGTGGVTDGAVSGCPPANITSNIRLNQIGFYTDCHKYAVIYGTPSGSNFYVKSTDLTTTYYTGTIGGAAVWPFSNETVRLADFSSFNTPGNYRLEVPGIGASYDFVIGTRIHHALGKAGLKAYYHQRGSTATTVAYAGVWARAAGHPDNNVLIHSSAASGARPTGTVVSSPKGWYDAGDYNSYIVNSGISTYTLLSSYEQYKSFFDTLNLVIPESGNGVPDILDEIRWNLDWMLTMQDPNDGGVYHKKTCLGFDGMIMPAASTCTRYLVAKSTAATFDFAAVMAVAYRVYKATNLAFANQCLTAAQNAYNWGIANPTVYFTNPGGVSTGEYGDGNVTDEREWAATELYIATLNNAYYSNSFNNGNFYGIPDWGNVRSLGLISLLFNRKNLTATGYADTTNMKNKMTSIANTYMNHWNTGSAYKVAMGGGGNGDFVWGSNAVAANIGMILLNAYKISANTNYYYAALSNMDYLMGRNAITYCTVTGFGSKRVMHPHHRPSEADGVTDPVPGLLSGGPNTDAPADCGSGYPSTTYKALCYQDNWCSYSTNEIAINWNAPLVYLAAGLDNLSPCGGTGPLPVSLLSFGGEQVNGNNVLTWETIEETGIGYYEIQRSSDGLNFSAVGKTYAYNGQSVRSYQWTDLQNPSGLVYYRLKIQEVSGAVSYSSIVVLGNNHTTEVSIFPNPASDEITIYTGNLSGTYEVYDGRGVLIGSGSIRGNQTQLMNVSSLSAGVYLFILRLESGEFVQRKVSVE